MNEQLVNRTAEGQLPYPPFPLKGQNCQCRKCGLLFRRTSTFDAHRYGPMRARRCHTSIDLAGKGWSQDAKGFWRRPGKLFVRDDRRQCTCGYGCPAFQGCRHD